MSNNDTSRTRAYVHVNGHVQGVFFRATAREQAASRDVTGTVKNLDDGRVEIIAEGERADVEALIAWCQHGPPRARVDGVEVRWAEPTEEYSSFEIDR